MTSGLSSIISVWAWYMSITLWRVMPAGKGVQVVKTDVLDMMRNEVHGRSEQCLQRTMKRNARVSAGSARWVCIGIAGNGWGEGRAAQGGWADVGGRDGGLGLFQRRWFQRPLTPRRLGPLVQNVTRVIPMRKPLPILTGSNLNARNYIDSSNAVCCTRVGCAGDKRSRDATR